MQSLHCPPGSRCWLFRSAECRGQCQLPSQEHQQTCHLTIWPKGRNGDHYSWLDSKIRKEFWWAVRMSDRFIVYLDLCLSTLREEGDVCPTERHSHGKDQHQCAKSCNLLCISSLGGSPQTVLNIQGRGTRGKPRVFFPPFLSVAVCPPKATLAFHQTHIQALASLPLFPTKDLLKQRSCYWLGGDGLSLMEYSRDQGYYPTFSNAGLTFCLIAAMLGSNSK